jgi:DNA polymerase I-like protein with 3'-5' exonuclease and polymerase domains
MDDYEHAERLAIQQQHLLPVTFDPDRYTRAGTLRLAGKDYGWQVWDGEPLGRYIALDTETTVLSDPAKVPQLAMVSISDGRQHFVAKPDQLAELLLKHLPYDHHIICHHIGFDFWVMDQHLQRAGEQIARGWLWSAVDQHRLHDSMLLAGLVTLALSDDDRLPSLADAARQWLGIELDKDTYRLRYAETIGQQWQDIETGFCEYAAADAITTWLLFSRLTHQAAAICHQHDLPRNYGFLTEALQVKAAIGLARISQNGLTVDLDRVNQLRQQVDQTIQQTVNTLRDIDANIWHRYKKTGKLKTTTDTGLPKLNQTTLQQHLEQIATQHGLQVPRTETDKPSLSVNQFWTQYRHLDPVVAAYCDYTENTKLRTFYDNLTQPRIHPRYRTLVRSGRTSCSSPNVQQLPRSSPGREAITARPGNLFFIIDYNSLELRTLATVCHQQIGFSKLRDVLVAGIDPHSYAAAIFAGCSLDEFNQRPDRKQLRQQAKVFNFGLPAGFGPAALVDHAKFAYGVELTLADAERFVHLLTREVYPELGLYLAEDTLGILAAKLRTDPVTLQALWPQDYQLAMLRKILAGNPNKADGSPYQPHTVDRIWQQLQQVCQNPDLLPHIHHRNTAPDSPLRKLLFSAVSTTTGRLRGGVRFTAAKNAPFQGLAADGCKQALWQLTRSGYRVVAFIHDEFIVELNRLDDIDRATEEIPRICSEALQPFVPGIPVPCEFALAERWYKQAEAIFNDAGQLQVWTPKKTKLLLDRVSVTVV